MKETVRDCTKKINYIDADFIRRMKYSAYGPSLVESVQSNLLKTEFRRIKVLFHVKYLCFMLVYTSSLEFPVNAEEFLTVLVVKREGLKIVQSSVEQLQNTVVPRYTSLIRSRSLDFYQTGRIPN
jgi:hypothetical protein